MFARPLDHEIRRFSGAVAMLLAGVLVVAGAGKALHPAPTVDVLRLEFGAPVWAATSLVVLGIGIEFGLASWLLWGQWPRAAGLCCFLFLTLVTAVPVSLWLRGSSMSCGCGLASSGSDQFLPIARNALLAVASIGIGLPPSPERATPMGSTNGEAT